MNYSKLSSRYERTEIATAGKIDLVILCYEKTIQSLRQVILNYEAKDYAAKAKAFTRAMNLINELQNSLDCEKGGEIAKNLDSIYSYLTRRLLDADIKKDISVFEEGVRILSELKEAWEGISSEEDNQPPINKSSKNITTKLQQIAA